MIRFLSILFFMALASAASAAPCAGVPYSFVNGTVIQAGQVNSNFTALNNCILQNTAANGVNSDITSLNGLTTPLSISQGGTGSSTGSVGALNAQGVLATVARSLNSHVADHYSVLDFGAACDGSTDDTNAINNAISVLGGANGGDLDFPAGICAVGGTLLDPYKGVTLVGQGNSASELLFTGSTTADGIQFGTQPLSSKCIGSTPPPACLNVAGEGITGFNLSAPNRTGGFLLNVNGVQTFTARDIFYSGWDAIRLQYSNTAVFYDMNGYTRDNSGYSVNLNTTLTSGSASWYNNTAPVFYNFIVNAQQLNSAGGCMDIDGANYTPILYSVHLLGCGYGLSIANSAASTTVFPSFLESFDLEIDGTLNIGLNIGAGLQDNFVSCDVDAINATNTNFYPLVISADYGFSYTRGITFTGCQFHDGPSGAAFIQGIAMTFVGDQFYDVGHSAVSGTFPTVTIDGANTDDIQITGSFTGERYGDSKAPQYGVLVDSTVGGGVALVGNDYTSAVTASVRNSAGHAIGLTGGINRAHGPITSVNCAATTSCD